MAGKHIKSFGSCSVMGKCKMESDLYGQFLIWFETYSKVIFAGSEALLEDSYCFCPYGGKITVSDSKQIDYASAMTELFGDFADTVEQMKDSIEGLSDMAVKSLIGMFDGAMTEYYANEENRLRNAVRDMERNNTGNSYMHMQTGYNPREELAQLQRSKAIYESNNWQDIKNVNLRDVYAKMQENPNKVDLGPRKISGLMALTNPLFAAGYYIETKVRDIRSVLPDMTIGDFFSRGTSKEGITELWEKGMDCQNKKMLPGVLGYHPLQAAYSGGYTNYDPMESAQIVNSLSDDGKAAYMLRKTANDGMSAYNEVYGYYQMVKAIDMAGKGKVKTGIKEKEVKKPTLRQEELVKNTAIEIAQDIVDGKIRKTTGGRLPAKSLTVAIDLDTDEIYYGVSGKNNNPTRLKPYNAKMSKFMEKVNNESLTNYTLDNCGEFCALNNGYNSGGKNFAIYSVNIVKGTYKAPCPNCVLMYDSEVHFIFGVEYWNWYYNKNDISVERK